MVREKIKKSAVITVMIAALACAAAGLAGCGGGSSDYEDACVKNPSICYGQTVVALQGSVYVPSGYASRAAGRSASLTNITPFSGATVTIGHMKYDETTGIYIDSDIVTSTTVDTNGNYTLFNVPTDDNMILTAYLTSGSTTYTVRNIVTVSDIYGGGAVAYATTTVETTFAYESFKDAMVDYNTSNATSTTTYDADDFSTSDTALLISIINTYLPVKVADGTVVLNSITRGNVLVNSLGSEQVYLMNSVSQLADQMAEMSVQSGVIPQVDEFSPNDGATNVAYDGTTFSVKFDVSMDADITPTGFSLTIQKSGGNSVAISSSNYSSYGSFSWTSDDMPNDTLNYTLKSRSTLWAAGLYVLEPSTTYTISTFTVPTNLVGANGTAADTTTNVPTSGSFTTRSM